MQVTILGCSGGIAEDLRTTCLMVDKDILIDVGTGAGDLTRNEMRKIEFVFLTHSHLDHVALLPMLANMVGPGRERPLVVYALPETIVILRQHVFNFHLWPDYTVLPSVANPYLVFKDVRIGETVELAGRRITPLPVLHPVPAVAYQLDSGKGSFVFSGDTSYHEPFWSALNSISNLRFLMIETSYLDHDMRNSKAAGHMRPELLARGLKGLLSPIQLLITHMEPGNEDSIMAEIEAIAGEFMPQRLKRGQIFAL
jgi:ribonuclease BN (tRNA processing enzyme)